MEKVDECKVAVGPPKRILLASRQRVETRARWPPGKRALHSFPLPPRDTLKNTRLAVRPTSRLHTHAPRKETQPRTLPPGAAHPERGRKKHPLSPSELRPRRRRVQNGLHLQRQRHGAPDLQLAHEEGLEGGKERPGGVKEKRAVSLQAATPRKRDLFSLFSVFYLLRPHLAHDQLDEVGVCDG